MREKLIRFNRNHPMTIRQMMEFGGFDNYAQCSSFVAEMRNQERMEYVGSLKNGPGRPLDVHCGWQPKHDNLRHEVKGTDFCLCYRNAQFLRGWNVGPLRPDIEMLLSDHRYLIEIDCGTMTRTQIQRRWNKYRNFNPDTGTLLIVAVSNKEKGIDSYERMQQLVRWSSNLFSVACFTTLETVMADPTGLAYWDAEHGEYRALNITLETT